MQGTQTMHTMRRETTTRLIAGMQDKGWWLIMADAIPAAKHSTTMQTVHIRILWEATKKYGSRNAVKSATIEKNVPLASG